MLIALITGFTNIIQTIPNIQALVASKVVGRMIFDIIEREPEIKDSLKSIKKVDLRD